MKAIFLAAALCILCSSLIAQQIPVTAEDYLEKSKNQRFVGYMATGLGTVSLITGITALNKTHGYGDISIGMTGLLLTAAGITGVTIGIVAFGAANRNERRAARLVSLQLNKPIVVNTGIEKKILPYSVGISIVIR